MERNKLFYINIALFIGLVLIMFAVRSAVIRPLKRAVEPKKGRVAAKPDTEEPPIYDINKIKEAVTVKSREEPKDIGEIFANFPKEDVGEDIVSGWAAANPQDKEKFIEGLDKTIEDCKNTLIANPNDEKAKKLVAMSETLKMLVAMDFNYKKTEKAGLAAKPQPQKAE